MREVVLALAAAVSISSYANADIISFSPPIQAPTRQVSAAESGNPAGGQAPINGDVYQFFVTTDADIVSVEQVRITGFDLVTPLVGLYNNAFGNSQNAEPGQPELVPVAPALAADSWVSTPGVTSRVGADLPGDGQTTFFDLTNDGLQTNFMLGQLTMPSGTQFIFTGVVNIAGQAGNFGSPFFFSNLPEPASASMAGLGLIGYLIGVRHKR